MDIVANAIEEWRELGFHYDRDDASRVWILTGSLSGLARFTAVLRDFAANSRYDGKFDHEHYGPYCFLKIMNVPNARGFDSNAIFGPRTELGELADLIESRLSNAKSGDTIEVARDFAPESEYELRLIVAGDDFDPGLFDPWIREQMEL